MTIRQSAYDTTATASYKVDKTLKNLEVMSSSDLLEAPEGVFGITGASAYERNIPAFVFPMHSTAGGQEHVYVDLRPYGTFDDRHQKFNMRYEAGANAAQLQGALSLSWMRGRQRSLMLASNLPIQVFMSWISEGLAKNKNLDGRAQYTVAILAGIFYMRNFTDKVWEAEDELLAVNFLTRTLRYSDYALNQELVKNHGDIKDVHDFCKACQEATKSVSLDNLNVSVLFAIVGGAMWGANASERLCVALEYPPAFITCLFQVVTDQSYRGKCELSKISQRGYLAKLAPEFVQGCLSHIDQIK